MKVAILGFGTVGQGVYRMVESSKDFENSFVLVRPGKKKEVFQTENIEDIVNDKSVEIVAECIGGTGSAFEYVKMCLEAGKSVVTPNKALVAEYGVELEGLAREHGVSFLFSAACGGAIPLLHNIAVASKTDRISRTGGILNGTTNFILSKMQDENKGYEECLKEAQRLGYAESDPTADVSGLDTLRKVMLISAVAFGKLPESGCCCEGIESFSYEIAADLKARGRVLRLIGNTGTIDENSKSGIYAYVEPVAVKVSDIEASISSNVNLGFYEAENAGKIVLSGQGAGRFPTASAVLRDLSAVRENVKSMLPNGIEKAKADNNAVKHSYYVCIDGKAEITDEISVSEMNARAKNIRERGSKVFFAEYNK